MDTRNPWLCYKRKMGCKAGRDIFQQSAGKTCLGFRVWMCHPGLMSMPYCNCYALEACMKTGTVHVHGDTDTVTATRNGHEVRNQNCIISVWVCISSIAVLSWDEQPLSKQQMLSCIYAFYTKGSHWCSLVLSMEQSISEHSLGLLLAQISICTR